MTTRKQRNRQWLNHQLAHARGAHRHAVWAGSLNGLAIILQMGLVAWLIQQAVVYQVPLASLLPPVLALMLVLLVRAGSQAWQEARGHLASQRIRMAVRQQLMSHWARLGPVRLAADSHAGIASQMVEQVEALDGYYARFRPQMTLCVVVPAAIVLTVLWLDWLAALFLLLSAPLIPLFMALVGMGAEKLNQQHFVLVHRLAGHFIDRVRGITSLQLFGQVNNATQQVTQAADQYRTLNMRTLKVAFLSSAVLEFFSSVAIAVVAIYIGFGLLGYIDYGPSPQLTLFSGLFALLLAPEFFQPLRQLAQHYHDRSSALGAADSLADFLEQPVPDSQTDLSENHPASVDACPLELSDLSVSFPGRGTVLHSISLSLHPGEMVALSGPSGVGKSTLLHVAAGFITPDTGQVQVDGRAAGSAAVAWMDQRPCLLHGTWADNLRLAAPDASADDMRAALQQAGLADVLAVQEHGLESHLGEGGRGLSGGQARRLALARVFLADTPLVLLDEPTTGLDVDSEQAVIRGLKKLAASGRTLLLATHHPELLAAADRMIELDWSLNR